MRHDKGDVAEKGAIRNQKNGEKWFYKAPNS